MNIRRIAAILLLPLLTSGSAASPGEKRVVGYYPSWMMWSFPHTSIRFDALTHIAHAFIFPNANGSLDLSTFNAYPDLIAAAHRNDVKVMISVGGWDQVRTPRFSLMTADSAARTAFVSNLTAFCITNGYDGADIDWEYPRTEADRVNHALLIHQLRAAFDAVEPRLLLAMAGPATWWGGQWFDFESTKNDFDWIGIMTYDYYGAWTAKAGPNSALFGETPNTEGWIDYSVSYYSGTRGIPKSKLLIGVPFYGQQFNAPALYGTSTGAVQILYKNIAPKMDQGWTRSWNDAGKFPYLINSAGTQVITYDDSQSVAEKCSYVRSRSLGGVIVWALGQDESDGQQPLLVSLSSNLYPLVGVPRLVTRVVPESLGLMQNFPNPFNSQTRIRYHVTRPMVLSLRAYDMLGREILVLAEGFHGAGEYEVMISSRALAAGSYLYRLDSPEGTLTRIFVVLP